MGEFTERKGWIKSYRSKFDNWTSQNKDYYFAWDWLLHHVNIENKKVLISSKLYIVKRGEIITSISKFGEAVGMTYQQVRTFWNLLQSDKMIIIESTSKLTRLTVCNYERYQDRQRTANAQTTHNYRAAIAHATTTKEYKEVKKLRKGAKYLDFFNEGKLPEIWENWTSFRAANRWKKYVVKGEAMALMNLAQLSGANIDTAESIIEQSIANSWQGLFALKNTKENNSNNLKQNMDEKYL